MKTFGSTLKIMILFFATISVSSVAPDSVTMFPFTFLFFSTLYRRFRSVGKYLRGTQTNQQTMKEMKEDRERERVCVNGKLVSCYIIGTVL